MAASCPSTCVSCEGLVREFLAIQISDILDCFRCLHTHCHVESKLSRVKVSVWTTARDRLVSPWEGDTVLGKYAYAREVTQLHIIFRAEIISWWSDFDDLRAYRRGSPPVRCTATSTSTANSKITPHHGEQTGACSAFPLHLSA